MRILGPNQTSGTASSSGARKASASGSFSLGETAASGWPQAAQAASGIGGLDSLLALQGFEDAGERRKRFTRRGRSALDLLDALKAELLSSDLRTGTLAKLQGMLGELTEKSGTPGLDEVLGEIELRVAVEIAKRMPKAA
ncbi:MAG TPA: flagellar assembly protein FliX [Xanthobacteraceae bacterium]|nr:flagellar assembly protein FliX [Xanthobacteraceae bacterium]